MIKDKHFQQLLIGMLSKNPLTRTYKFKQIKAHEYFKDFNWENLISMSLKPPYIPTIPNSQDKIPFNFKEFITVI